MKQITLKDYLMGRDYQYPQELTDELRANAEETCRRTNLLLDRYFADNPDDETGVNSGWRPAAINRGTPGAAKKSKHMVCKAIDLEDDEGAIDDWCMNNLHVLEELELWLEHPSATKGWCHLQTVPPRSKNRVFYP